MYLLKRIISRAIATASLFYLVHVHCSLIVGADEAKSTMTPAALAEQLSNVDDGQHEIRVDNSHIYVDTPAISRIVSKGYTVIPNVISLMKDNSISFDLFVRCYSVCDQILSPKLSGQHIWWTGGCETRKTTKGIVRFGVGGQMDVPNFRNKVIDDIEKKYDQITKK